MTPRFHGHVETRHYPTCPELELFPLPPLIPAKARLTATDETGQSLLEVQVDGIDYNRPTSIQNKWIMQMDPEDGTYRYIDDSNIYLEISLRPVPDDCELVITTGRYAKLYIGGNVAATFIEFCS